MEKINKNIERVFNKCIILIYKGYSIQYCLSKFKKHSDILEDYLVTVGKLKDLEKVKPGNDYIKNTLYKIYRLSEGEIENNTQEIYISENKNSINSRVKIRSLIFKPAIIFLLVFIVVSFSFVGLAFGSQRSIPTETMYPVKRTVEKIVLVFNPVLNEGSLHFQFLESRLYEANKLIDYSFSNNIDLIGGLLLEIKDEYEQCKKYNYFGDKSEKEIINFINSTINKYKNKLSKESQKIDDKSNQSEKLEDDMDENSEYNTDITNEVDHDDNKGVDETSHDDSKEVDETSHDDNTKVDETNEESED